MEQVAQLRHEDDVLRRPLVHDPLRLPYHNVRVACWIDVILHIGQSDDFELRVRPRGATDNGKGATDYQRQMSPARLLRVRLSCFLVHVSH